MNVLLRQWRHSDDVLKFHRRLTFLFRSHTEIIIVVVVRSSIQFSFYKNLFSSITIAFTIRINVKIIEKFCETFNKYNEFI